MREEYSGRQESAFQNRAEWRETPVQRHVERRPGDGDCDRAARGGVRGRQEAAA